MGFRVVQVLVVGAFHYLRLGFGGIPNTVVDKLFVANFDRLSHFRGSIVMEGLKFFSASGWRGYFLLDFFLNNDQRPLPPPIDSMGP